MTDDIKNVVPFRGRARRPEPLTAEERWFDQLVRDFGQLPVEAQLDVIFAACDDNAKAQIAERLVDYLNWYRGAPDNPPEAA